jgi:hypothetical protein
MNYIGLRISQIDDIEKETPDYIVKWLNEYLLSQDIDSKVFGVFEHKGIETIGTLGEPDFKITVINPHYHFIILDSSYTEGFRKSFYRFFEKKDIRYKTEQRGKRMLGGKNYKMKDIDKGYKYLCKGENKDTLPVIVINDVNLTDEEIKNYHSLNYGNYDIVKEELQRDGTSTVKKIKEKKLSRVQEYHNWFESTCLPKYINKLQPKFTVREIVKDILEFFKNLRMLYKKQLIEQYLHYTMNMFVREYQPENFQKYESGIIAQLCLYDFNFD